MPDNVIPIVDLFAGPGGLGEGFSSLGKAFKIVVSVEKDPDARRTLRMRAYFRILRREYPNGVSDYYRFCNGEAELPWSLTTRSYWDAAGEEALQLELGTKEGNARLDDLLTQRLDVSKPWVLIGGPPCQAYSLVGRARNKGTSTYKAEEDHRHFLYKEYLRIIRQYRPSVFVMENVKGILSARVSGNLIFHDILRDLSDPEGAAGGSEDGEKYVICSLVNDAVYRYGDDPAAFDARKFIIRAEEHGIPQARHRVILLGIRESLFQEFSRLPKRSAPDLIRIIGGLPPLRSRLSKIADSEGAWYGEVVAHLTNLLKHVPADDPLLRNALSGALSGLERDLDFGGLRVKKGAVASIDKGELDLWYLDDKLKVWLNHESRGHMSEDLRRYAYAASFARARGRSPKGHLEFDLPGLAPAHENWESGKFTDRFRVQLEYGPSTTITSHISKDGHYFIHPKPEQCRSLTVREAARLQTFPDNYFFLGGRTQQFHQVGNAVPPLLARKIAEVVKSIVD